MVYPLILMSQRGFYFSSESFFFFRLFLFYISQVLFCFDLGKLSLSPKEISVPMRRSLSFRLRCLGSWISLSTLFIATKTFS